MMEWHPVFRVGRGRLAVSFTGGHLCGGGCTPASFETSDPVVQKVIESSDAFRRGLIRGDGRADRPTVAREKAHAAVAEEAEPREEGAGQCQAMEFPSLEKAQDFLQSYKGVRIDDMLELESCVATGRRLGIDLIIGKGVAS